MITHEIGENVAADAGEVSESVRECGRVPVRMVVIGQSSPETPAGGCADITAGSVMLGNVAVQTLRITHG